MKRTIVLAALALVSLGSCKKEQIKNEVPEITQTLKSDGSLWDQFIDFITIEVDIIFGTRTLLVIDGKVVPTPCTGSGLCEIKVSGNSGGSTGDVLADVALIDDELVFGFKKSTLTAQEILTYFPNGQFNLPVDKELPIELTNALNIPAGRTISAGLYEIVYENSDYILVNFN